MGDFPASLSPFGWVVLAFFAVGVATLPRAVAEHRALRGPATRFWRGLSRGQTSDGTGDGERGR